MPSNFTRLFLVFLLSFVASSSLVAARPLDSGLAYDLPSWWRQLGGFVGARLVSPVAKDDRGCTIDPNGQPVCAPKRGCTIDPNGQPICTSTKRGCTIDPDGQQVCTP